MEIMAAISSLANYTRIEEAWVRNYTSREGGRKEGSRGNWEEKIELCCGSGEDLPVSPLISQKRTLLATTRSLGESSGGWRERSAKEDLQHG